ncbi:beta-galactoside alpha-2,6-sialyltransferase 1-like [Chanos chanos]|uniref:Beta-galactoside alpha-2,6-sialyltransferase 1 n=1 Tax=Chanos chanos TaxID=29144 RepID=A0A6J2UVT0_CHACN|nr:beta-galactoside alpha-2,6-sialyltransferase 1-like [Chanos chanos]
MSPDFLHIFLTGFRIRGGRIRSIFLLLSMGLTFYGTATVWLRERARICNESRTYYTETYYVPEEVLDSIKFYRAENRFGVNLDVGRQKVCKSYAELMCELNARVPLGTVRAGDGPFSGGQWDHWLPKWSLQDTVGHLRTCAVVMSSGALRNSSLAAEIDSHEAVLRFNMAPTEGYSADVGTKTTLRIINSKVVTSDEAEFLKDPLYNTGVLIMWDPAPYSADLYSWYKKPDYDFHQRYWDYRRLHPNQPFYILSPSMQWKLWDVIQRDSPVDIQPNPPSSGMLGIIVMMNLCERVDVYEFLPSYRRTDLCHYYEEGHNWQCTVGHYHPLTFEKNIVHRLNQGEDQDIQKLGKVTLYGFSTPCLY